MNVNDVLELLLINEKRAQKTINMVPSENFTSVFSRVPLLLDTYNRYFFNEEQVEEHWNFRGAQDVADIETKLAIPLLREMSKAQHINLRPISGLNCMSMVLSALGGERGSDIMLVSPDQGGHYATKNLAESFGYRVHFLTGPDAHTIDLEDFEQKISKNKIKLVYIDQSNCLFPIEVGQLAKVIRRVSPDTIIHVDASHWMGLILGNAMKNPLDEGADSFGGSTHKTFPGPQRALFFTNNVELSRLVKQKQYYSLSSHHFGTVISLALCLLEFNEENGESYARLVVDNSKKLAQNLDSYGFDVKGKNRGFTCGHQIWMTTNNVGIDSFESSKRLFHSGIRVNVFDSLPDANESIIRLGVNEITRFGATPEDMVELAALMYESIHKISSVELLQKRVEKLRNKNKMACTFNTGNPVLRGKIKDLIATAFSSELSDLFDECKEGIYVL